MFLKRGFSLLEILLAIAITGILASAIAFALVGRYKTTRDGIRKKDLADIALALTNYYLDGERGVYPNPDLGGGETQSDSTQGDNWIPGLKPGYLKTLPKDPKQAVEPDFEYFYIVSADLKTATLWTTLERTGDKDIYNQPEAKCKELPPENTTYNFCRTSKNDWK